MAKTAFFIGINKYADPAIRDLSGASKDAIALWALFSDSAKDFDCKLLIDHDATAATVKAVFADALRSAGEEDEVIISFSGHGSRDHRLILHDTSRASIEASTLSMEEIAELFKATKAKAVLLILDCCFSGGAPAKVVDDFPVARNDVGATLHSLAGSGKVLISAANEDQPAYELPTTGHGLLTKAIIDVLQQTKEPIGVGTAMELVMDQVRAESARIGVVQTPIHLGYVEGGLLLPPLSAGEEFHRAFPSLRGMRIGGKVEELSVFGLPNAAIQAWQNLYPTGLNALQLAAVNDNRILDGESLLVVAPTSSGKTFVGELASARAVAENRKAVFLLPYKALVNEKYDQFSEIYANGCGYRVIRCTGDYLDQTNAFVRGKYDIALLTYETFLQMVVSNPSILNSLGLVVLDEAQFIADPGRGISVELLLTYLISAREKGISPQIVALSAVIGGLNDFDAWLGCSKLVQTERPVKLVEGVMDRSGAFQYRDDEGRPALQQLVYKHDIFMRKDKPQSQDMIVPLVKKLVSNGEKVILFRNAKGPAKGCANYLARELGLPPAEGALAELPVHDMSAASGDLRDCLIGGSAFHTTNLNREERAVVERWYRKPDGGIEVLAATTTVAAGINTPASTVILAEQEFVGEDGRPFTVAEYKNMAGRAGRLGFNEIGRSVILAETAQEREVLYRKYVDGVLGHLVSSFDLKDLNTWVIRLLAQVGQVPRQDVSRLLSNTFAGFTLNRQNPNWGQTVTDKIDQLTSEMIRLALIEEEGEMIQLTLLGRACGRSSLSFRSAMRLVDLVRQSQAYASSPGLMIALVQVLEESDGGYTPVQKAGQAERRRIREATERYGSPVVSLLQKFAKDEWDYYGRCKRAAILWDWTHGVAISEIESRYSTTPYRGAIGHGDIRKFADNTRFHLRAAFQIAALVTPALAMDEQVIEDVLRQLEVGLPTEALPLLELPVNLMRGQYLVLSDAGFRSVGSVWQAEQDHLSQLIGKQDADRLIAASLRENLSADVLQSNETLVSST